VSALEQYRIVASSAAGLVRAVEDAVAAGELPPGRRLPSVRHLSASVGLSPATVSSALAELRRRGVVVSEPRRGIRIGDGPPIGLAREPLPVPAGARDLSRGNPDPELLPDLSAALARMRLRVRLYGESAVDPSLAALAREQLAADGLDSGALCVVSGALDGIERVLGVHLRTGDAVAVENPGYAALYDLLRAHGLPMEAVEVDDRGMLPGALRAALERGARAVVITPRGQNPTGATLDPPRASALREVLEDFPQALLIEDDHLGPVAGSELHTTTTPERTRWAATRSVAKSLGPDLRLAVLTGDPHTVASVEGRQQCGPGWVSHVLQSLVLELWSEPDVAGLIARAEATYAARRQRLLAHLRDLGVEAHGAAGLNVWIPVGEEAAVVAALIQKGWVVAPGSPYRLPGARPAVRITTATLTEQEAELLAADLAAALAQRAPTRGG
jgi:DNA-binding transcriptional MocR family regulator